MVASTADSADAVDPGVDGGTAQVDRREQMATSGVVAHLDTHSGLDKRFR